jgi:hypothetical protein
VKTQGFKSVKPSLPTAAKLVRLYPSLWYLRSIILFHIVALTAVCLSAMYLWIKACLVIWVLMSAALFFRQWRRQMVLRVQYVHGYWCLIPEVSSLSPYHPQELAHPYKIITWHYWSVWMLVLLLENHQGQPSRLVVVFDSCTADEFRWLRVVVKYLVSD